MKSVSVQTRRPVLSREAIGRVIGGWPIWLHRAGLGRLAGRRHAVICWVGRRIGRVRCAALVVLREDPVTGWQWPGSTEDVVSLAASLGGVSFAPAPRPGARDARPR